MQRLDSYIWITINSDGSTVSSIVAGSQFTLNIAPSIDLGAGNHEIALHSLSISPAVAPNRILVYCNLVQPQHINNTKFQLMRAIGYSPIAGIQSYELGSSLQWMKMASIRNISQIEFTIADSLGAPIVCTAPTLIVLAIRDL